ncbi:MAG TPA: hypothetical protein VGF45_19105, partial [Polyangia bacterium]
VCDDAYRRAAPDKIRRSSLGDIFIPTTTGLLVTSDGCSYAEPSGDIAGKTVVDVAVDTKDPTLVFALGDTPRKLWRSADRGRTFAIGQTFADGVLFQRILLPPTRSQEVYLVGRGRDTSTPIAASQDNGTTFVMRDPGLSAGPMLRTSLDPLAPDPRSPNVLYVAVVDAAGDQLWRSNDGGATVSPVMTVQNGEALGGLAFGSAATTIYVAGKAVFLEPGKPRGHLYVSRDSGKTWLPAVPSDENGPQYNCLVAVGDELFACGVSVGVADRFLLGVTKDEGKTWSYVTGLGDLKGGPKQCVASQCQLVSAWLCDFHSSCAPGTGPANMSDAGRPSTQDGGTSMGGQDATSTPGVPPERKGGGCQFGGRRGDGAAWVLGVILALLFPQRSRSRVRRFNGR